MEHAVFESTLETSICPEQVLDVLEQPELLPRWAPAFADHVEPLGRGAWKVTKNSADFEMQVETSRMAFTAEYKREIEGGRKVGAVVRLLHRIGGGCILRMTLPDTGQSSREVVEKLLREELDNLVALTRSLVGPAYGDRALS